MVDIPGDGSTTSTVSVGSTFNGSIESGGDHDWIRITLAAGQTIQVVLSGFGASALEDPYLRIRNSSGTVISENDDGGDGRNSLLAFEAPVGGVYYIDVSAWDDAAGTYKYTGDYQLQVTNYTPPPLGTIAQISNQLTSAYWEGDSHHFAVTQGGSISVNLTALTSAGQNLAREALHQWSDVIGVTFTEVARGGQIVFDDDQDGASASATWSQGVISSAHVNVSTAWLSDYGTTVGSYSFQTYIHEIGHALGLGHAGNYNGEARFPVDALFLNDAWSTSVMSYFSPTENTYFSGLGFGNNYLGTPMQADILAISQLYGLSTTTRVGDTTYGFNSTAGNDVYNASLFPSIAYTVFDSGGIDTLDYSGFASNQRIDLRSGNFSNVGSRTGNVAIAIGVVIENAIGGSGSDELYGNEADNLLIGNAGNDGIYGFGGNDTIIGGDGDDRISAGDGIDTVTYANAAAAIYVNSQTVSSVGNAAGIGTDELFDVEIIIGGAYNDTFSGNGLVQRFEGGPGDDTFSGQGGADIFVGGSGADTFRDTLDWLNGDTISDFSVGDRIILSDATLAGFTYSLSGNVLNYMGRSLTLNATVNGSIVASAASGGGVQLTIQSSSPSEARNDFNGDGRSDILWRDNSGLIADWLGTASGGFADNYAKSAINVPTSWQVAGTGDFNGDGRDDILWRSNSGLIADWLGTASGGFADNYANSAINVPTSWQVAGTGDFNGDGRDDILWRSDSGLIADWLGTASGGFADNYANSAINVPTSWQVAGTGDFNGDGRDDILWRNDSGIIADWLGMASGGFADNYSASAIYVPTEWQIQAPDILWA